MLQINLEEFYHNLSIYKYIRIDLSIEEYEILEKLYATPEDS